MQSVLGDNIQQFDDIFLRMVLPMSALKGHSLLFNLYPYEGL
jgi:hypothetical protein